MLTVCDRGPDISRPSKNFPALICKCVCGNYTLITVSAFKNGTTKSCGCYSKKAAKKRCSEIGKQKHYKDYSTIENIFYNFIKPTNKIEGGSRVWIVECKNCGKRYEEVPAYLISETRQRGNNPCNCRGNQSKGVLKIIKLLQDNNIKFEQEKKFIDCVSPKNNQMKFDFWVENRYLIEYDGEQHFKPISFYGNSITDANEKLKLQQEYDNIKNKWCLEKNITLIRIPYYHYKDIKIEDLIPETSNFLYKGE